MLRFIKNKFLFILLISIFTFGLLIVGSIVLHKDSSVSFNNDGYIISTSAKSTKKYYFSANTNYRNNADGDITFKNTKSFSVSVSVDNFVHYSDGSVGYLKRGALVNLNDINSSIIPYYNVNSSNLVGYKNGNYYVVSDDKNISLSSFVGRISENKFIICGNDVSLQVSGSDKKVKGSYFEVLYIENGVVKIDNQEVSYQVTAQDSYINVGDGVVIDLGSKKIFYNGEAKMLLSQITINGDENIDLDDISNKGTSDSNDESGSSSDSGNSDDTKEEDNKSNKERKNDNNGSNNIGVNSGSENEKKDDTKEASDDSSDIKSSGIVNDVLVELITAKVTSTALDATFQLNNSSSIEGNLVASIVNVLTGETEYVVPIDKVNGTFYVKKESLSPSTEYNLLIYEANGTKSKNFFQKVFKTENLGVTLEREYATSNSLAYNVVFDSNSDVSKVRVVIANNNSDSNDYFEVSKDDISTIREFKNLTSNTNYSVSIDALWIDNAQYSSVYNVNRIDATLKEIPSIDGVSITTNSDEIKFNVKLGEINDPDNSILSYVYEVYLADDVRLDSSDITPVYTVSKNDPDDLVLDLNKISELKTGVDYRLRVLLQYNDNEMIRETASDYSANFLLKSKPNFTFTQTSTSMNKVSGTLKLIDANCSVPFSGRSCLNKNNTFVLRYYKIGTDEAEASEKIISLSPNDLSANVTFDKLSSDTTYVVKVYGNYYDDNNVLHEAVQLGDDFHIKTDESENLKLKILSDNISGTNKDGSSNSANVVTFDAALSKPADSEIDEEVSSITLNLYSGSYNNVDKLIGTVTITDKNKIMDFFSSYTITNSMFINDNLDELNSLSKMIRATNNSTNTLNQAYTVEVVDVLDSSGINKINVEDNIYTFRLTPNYYLDSRIATYPNEKYINVSMITKEELSDSDYTELSKKVSNLDDLNDSTVVGVTIENSLSDAFVDSAYVYEKVFVDYVIYNNTTHKEVKRISVDMGNKYQPKEKIIYLDRSDMDDGSNFNRGYNYKIGYELRFITEKGDNPTYTNNKLYYNTNIDRQMAIYQQYISSSTSDSITFRYSITDIDNALDDHNLYYSSNEVDIIKVEDELVIDGNYHNITIPMNERGKYFTYFKKKLSTGNSSYFKITDYNFESEYSYDNSPMYSLVNDNSNLLKIKINDSDVTNRAVAYRVVIKDNSGENDDYVRYFLASQLNEVKVSSGNVDEDGNEIFNVEKYIYVDYAAINTFMGKDLSLFVYDYYDSGLVGLNQNFENGLILENVVKKKYLNIYNSTNDRTTYSEDNVANGIYLQKTSYELDSDKMYLYNNLYNTKNYNSLSGTYSYSSDVPHGIGINYNLSFTNNGVIFSHDGHNYSNYNLKALNVANLKTNNNSYKFNSITPKVSLDITERTINSISFKVNSSGVYGQFTKDGAEHNKFYLEIYSDNELENKLKTLVSDITITDNTAVSEVVNYNNLKPDTTYYVSVFAYLNGEYTKLYDMNTNGYVVKTYEVKTLDAKGILDKITYSVKPVKYVNNGNSSEKNLIWKLKLKNTSNYKIRFELFDIDGNPVNFDGSTAASCNKDSLGSDSDGYVNGCYIQVGKDDISSINNKDLNYSFTGNNFVFGGNYYKLYVYAVPYYTRDNNEGFYSEDDKIILYENESLSTTGDKTIVGDVSYNITIPTLEEASFNLNNTLVSGYRDDDLYYIEFVPTITDNYFVINGGKYTVRLKDEKGSVVAEKNDQNVNTIGDNLIKFTNLSANTLYYIELSYTTYRNNVGYTETQKKQITPFTDFIYTPIDAGITLGTITAQENEEKKIILTYNGASNMTNNIVRVRYTVSLKGGSSKANGEYSLDNSSNIFTITSDKMPRLTIDLSLSNDSSFTLKSGNTYIISTQYWYMEDGEEVQLTDRSNGNTTFTTILNL